MWLLLFVASFRAEAAGDHGSDFLQAFAKILKYRYKDQPLDRIYLMVKQYMAKSMQVEILFVSEEKNSIDKPQ